MMMMMIMTYDFVNGDLEDLTYGRLVIFALIIDTLKNVSKITVPGLQIADANFF